MQRPSVKEEKRHNSRTNSGATISGKSPVETKKLDTSSRTSEQPGSGRPRGLKTLEIYDHDLPIQVWQTISQWTRLGIDTETDGLDYHHGKLLLVQLCNDKGEVYMIRRPDWDSIYLKRILEDHTSVKIFHHCLFDLRFLKTGTGANVNGTVECTKTMMKISHPECTSGLAATLREMLGITISKAETRSDWNAKTLTKSQLNYAAGDVVDLVRLAEFLKEELRTYEKGIYTQAIETIRLKVLLEAQGYTDLLDYQQETATKTLKNRSEWRRKAFAHKEIKDDR